jgi:hypothetical protein
VGRCEKADLLAYSLESYCTFKGDGAFAICSSYVYAFELLLGVLVNFTEFQHPFKGCGQGWFAPEELDPADLAPVKKFVK